MNWFEGFELKKSLIDGLPVNYRISQDWASAPHKPVLLLLHGFPQTHVMWQRVAQRLKHRFRLVMPDLRGYGDSSHELGLANHENYSKRSMAKELTGLMDRLGADRFNLCGHDRGGRVAHRLALDHSNRVSKLCVIDIAPTLDMYNATNMEFARAYYHWFHLIQPAPLPEMMIGGNPKGYLHAKLGGWGSNGLGYIEPEALAEYERCFCNPQTNEKAWPAALHSAAEDYRASAGIDLQHDAESRSRAEKLACDLLVLWGDRGVVHRMFKPIALWQAQCAGMVSGKAMPAGHFIPEELPVETAEALQGFFA
jgi:haloacetate dehalogenase